MNKLLCIIGPTATGKTDLALALAKKFNGEIISCDSRQVYRGLDIGTGKLPGVDVSYQKHDTVWIIDGVSVWLYDVLDPQFQYDVWQYVKDAKAVIERISGRGKLPLLVGGTGLYLKGLLEGFSEMEIPVDLSLRKELESLDLEEVQQRLVMIDKEYLNSLNNSELHNKRRLIRRIEKVVSAKEVRQPQFKKGLVEDFQVLKIGLFLEDRALLYRRIDERVDKRITAGMIEEAIRLEKEGVGLERMKQLGLEYGLLAELLAGNITREQFSERLKFRIHQYAKRQLTWFRANKDIEWFDITKRDFERKVEEKVQDWYNSKS